MLCVSRYHDHSMGITAETVMAGLAGTFWTQPCNASAVPPQIYALGRPQYLVLGDNVRPRTWERRGGGCLSVL